MHSPIPGSELTREPFRWDQRLFALVLRLSGTPANERDIGLVPSDNSPIDAMCEVTGGRSYCITSHRMMMQCIDSLVQKVQSGVVINFEKIGPDPCLGEVSSNSSRGEESIVNITIPEEEEGEQPLMYTLPPQTQGVSWHSCRKMIFVQRSAQKGFAVGFWPIPESFWPDINISVLPARSAHPNVKFTCINQEPMVIENLPFDKYELEPSPLTQYILARKQPTICWQVFVPNSYKNSEVGHPFGYLKASTNLTCVNLFVMPYNYPVLLPLLDELFKVLRLKQTNEWTAQFRNYMRTMPSYYVGPLRRALIRMGAPNSLAQTLIPDTCEATLNVTVLNYVKKLKNQAKIEFDRLCIDVLTKQTPKTHPTNPNRVKVTQKSNLKRDLVTHPHMLDTQHREQLNDYGGFVVGLPQSRPNLTTKNYRNPYQINRSNLLDQVVRMRSNYLQPLGRMKLLDDDVTHSLPVNQMGNYQEYLKRMPPPLREIESTPVRQHMFGNPFKIDKRMMVDEADIDLVGSLTVTNKTPTPKRTATDLKAPTPKRKPGPIPKDVVAKRPPIIAPIIPLHVLPLTLPTPAPPILTREPTPEPEAPLINNIHIEDEPPELEYAPPSPPPPSVPPTSLILPSPLPTYQVSNYLSPLNYSTYTLSEDISAEDATHAYSSNVIYNNDHNLKIDLKYENGIDDAFGDEDESDCALPPPPSIEDPEICNHNLKIKKLLFQDVRKPGKSKCDKYHLRWFSLYKVQEFLFVPDYTGLWDHMVLLKGEFCVQEVIVKQVLNEALRFKRHKLARTVTTYLEVSRIDSIHSTSTL